MKLPYKGSTGWLLHLQFQREFCLLRENERKKEKGKQNKTKHMFDLYNHLLTQVSIIVILKHHFLDWSLMGRECYKENI